MHIWLTTSRSLLVTKRLKSVRCTSNSTTISCSLESGTAMSVLTRAWCRTTARIQSNNSYEASPFASASNCGHCAAVTGTHTMWIIYCGKDSGAVGPLGERVVTKMVDLIERNSSLSNHHMYFDNFFTSYRLLTALRDRGICATGTVASIGKIGPPLLRKNGAHKVLMTSS
jgi:predicted molibdopterin-dependent oxidoreductase YjgC